MKRKRINIQEIFNFILSPPDSKNQELNETIDFILSHPLPPGSATSAPPLEKPPDEMVKNLLDWLGYLWVPERIQDPPPPFPWAANTTGTKICTLEYILYTLHIDSVSADFKCMICGDVEKVEYNLAHKYMQVSDYIHRKGTKMGGIASNSWQFPTRPQCKNCNNKRRCLEEVIKKDNNSINWLFLFVGKLIGCCKVQQLKEFCEQNEIECSGTKPRLVYLTYLGLCKQLDPQASYDM